MPVKNAHIQNNPSVIIVVAIENECPRGSTRAVLWRNHALAFWRRNIGHNTLKHCVDTLAGFCGYLQNVFLLATEQADDFAANLGDVCGGEVYFVQDRDDGEIGGNSEVHICERLRLDALARIDNKQRTLTGLQAAAHLIREVNMAGSIDEVQFVALVLHADRRELDGNALFALQVHAVKQLGFHVALLHGASQLEQTVSQRRLTVVYMRDNTKVPNMILVHRKPLSSYKYNRGDYVLIFYFNWLEDNSFDPSK